MAGKEKHPCAGCRHWYGEYKVNRCCNYIFDVGRSRPCPPGEGCTQKKKAGPKTAARTNRKIISQSQAPVLRPRGEGSTGVSAFDKEG